MTQRRWLRPALAFGAPAALLAVALGCSGDSTGSSNNATKQGTYTITVRFIDTTTPPTAAVSAAFAHAVAKWQAVIQDSVGSVAVTLPATACDSAQPAINETIKDLLILVNVRQIPDTVSGQTILGEGGPCIIRIPGNLPAFGVMSLNSTALQELADDGLLDVVIEHEFAHILGFGTIWDLDGYLQDSSTTTPWFSGSQAQAAFRAAAPTFTGKVVPVEGSGQAGFILSHWRETVFTNELMTGLIDPAPDPLSAVTVASMADLGYAVNTAAAETWPTASASAESAMHTVAERLVAVGRASANVAPITLRRPTYQVDATGALTPVPRHRQ